MHGSDIGRSPRGPWGDNPSRDLDLSSLRPRGISAAEMSRVLIVTGASRGIGAATARLAAQRGYAVAVNYLRNQAAAETVVREIRAQGGTALAIAADIAQESEVQRLFT